MKTVLILDRDLGFVVWLGTALGRTGYLALPARSSQDALELLKQFDVPIHLLIVACALPDAGVLVGSLRHSHQDLKIIGVTDDTGQPCPSVPEADLVCPRSRPGEDSETDWLERIQGLLADDYRAGPRTATGD